MEEQTEKEMMDWIAVKQPEAGPFVQKLEILGHLVSHENKLLVEKNSRKYDQVMVNNYYAHVGEDIVVKVTEIHLDGRTIKIIDSFTCPMHPQFRNSKEIDRKTTPINMKEKMQLHQTVEGEKTPKTKRNIVKNLFRLFKAWVKEGVSQQLELNHALNLLCKVNGKYNKNLILRISREPTLRRAFITFSGGEGEELIHRSRIQNKQAHVENLQKFHRICCQQDFQEEIQRNLSSNSDEVSISNENEEMEEKVL